MRIVRAATQSWSTILLRSMTKRWIVRSLLMVLCGVAAIHQLHPMTSTTTIAAPPRTDGMAACLLVMDDNHWLIEWLAYHYHVLPLRHLIIVKDPNSRTSPNRILERWQSRITIEQWTDDKILPRWVQRKYKAGQLTATNVHRYRQQFFYAQCLKHYQANGQSWVLMTDTDEFVRPNELVVPYPPSLRPPGAIQATLDRYSAPICLHIPRLQVSTRAAATIPPMPVGFNASEFLTTSLFYHNGKEITTGHNLDGKNLIDVSRLSAKDMPRKAENVHYVMPSHCPAKVGREAFLRAFESCLSILHYPGSYEQFTYRDDPRNNIKGRKARDYRQWAAIGLPAEVYDDGMIEWLPGFVTSVGATEALRLLEGVGQIGYE